MRQYDVIVVGLGIMGAATLWQLSKAGVRVLGMETSGPAHCNGSSHGATRIFRRAYFEGDSYLPLLNLAHAGWQELQATTQRQLMHPTGGVFIGAKHTGLVDGSLRTARLGNIEHAHWNADALRSCLPQFSVEHDMHAVFEAGAYALASDAVRLQLLDESVRHGAEVSYGTHAASLYHSSAGLSIIPAKGVELRSGAAVITTGAWLGQLLPELDAHLNPKHVPVYWFAARPGCEAQFAAGALPVFVYECADATQLYGIPTVAGERGVKIGFHNRQQLSWEGGRKPVLSEDLRREIGQYVTRIFPNLLSEPSAGTWCIYTLSPDGSFLIGESQHLPRVYYASACSGHGFKFATGIGSVLAALARGDKPPVPIEGFAARRFATRRSA